MHQLVLSGYKEVVITGINVGDYRDGEKGLAELIQAVDSVEGIERIRLSSIDPDEVDEKLMAAILNGKRTCHSMHIVLQAGSNVVLKRMNRKYTRQIFFESIQKLLDLSSDFTFTTDVIVGFPGETDADFEETLDVMRKVRFAKVHMFPYSRRERTRAALFPNQVPPHILQVRKSEVLRLSEELSYALREHFVGRTMEILTESGDDKGAFGHTQNFLPVKVPNFKVDANQLISVKLLENSPDALIGIPTT